MPSLEEKLLVALMVPQVNPFDINGVTSPATRWGLPLNIGGLSGIGKSQRVAQVAQAVALVFQKVMPSHKQPEDFGGVPMRDAAGELVLECILQQARHLINAGEGILFIDELSTARPAVQSVCLGVVDERRVGDHLLPNTVRVITAMNPPEYAAGGFSLEAPLANRLAHITMDPPTPQEWSDWLLGRTQQQIPDHQQAAATIKQNWHEHWPVVRALVAGFIESVGASALHAQPKPDDEASSGAWPSPRMWYLGTCAIATVRALGASKELENELLFACVGDKLEAEWVDWCVNATIPTPYEMLTNGWLADAQRLDITVTALTGMTAWLVQHPDKTLKTALAGKAWEILEDAYRAGLKDLILPSARDLASAQAVCGVALNHECPNAESRAAAAKALRAIGSFASMQVHAT